LFFVYRISGIAEDNLEDSLAYTEIQLNEQLVNVTGLKAF